MTDNPSYFKVSDASESGEPGTWIALDREMSPYSISEGLTFQPVVGGRLAINLVRFEPNTIAPRHAHEEEQIAFILEGELEFEVGGETRVLGPHEAVVIPPHTPHAARTYDKPCVALDTFSPPRSGLAEIMQSSWSRSGEHT
jgi:quercetin dioxygenase-like cupin family protein